jgi:ATP synthase protein I
LTLSAERLKLLGFSGSRYSASSGSVAEQGMWKVVFLQIGTLATVALATGLLAGRSAAVSAVLGGAAYVLPNALFVARLKTAAAIGRAGGATLLVWELIKVALVIGILAGIARYSTDLHWIALLAGLSATLVVNLFALLLRN